MKHSASYPLFFACLSLFLICTSATEPKKRKRTASSPPTDANFPVASVGLGDQYDMMSGPPRESAKVPRLKKAYSERLAPLLEEGDYEGVSSLCNKRRGGGWKQLYPLITLGPHKQLIRTLKANGKVSDFLVDGDMGLVRSVIVGERMTIPENHVEDDYIHSAIILSLEKDKHDRALYLMGTVLQRYTPDDRQYMLTEGGTKFEGFVQKFLEEVVESWKGISMPLKRFLTLHGEELKRCAIVFETLCRGLVYRLKDMNQSPRTMELFDDLVGQPSLLTPAIFAKEFLSSDNDHFRGDFLRYGWREAIEEGLKSRYIGGGQPLWSLMVRKVHMPTFGMFPPTELACTTVLQTFPTKQDREEAWAKENAPNFQKMFLDKFLGKLEEEGIHRLVAPAQ